MSPPQPLPEGEGLSSTLAQATRRLAPVSDTPRLDAELLLAHALGITRDRLLLVPPPGPVPPAFETLLARRLAREPLSHILGRRGFWSIELAVTPDVLTPRPETELLLEAALAHFGAHGPARVLDLGTGSGALLLAALAQWPDATGVGVDASPAALAVAGANAERLGLAGRATFRLGDWGAGLHERFDLVLCNPPYVEAAADLAPEVRDHEPHLALFAGADGLDAHRRIAPQLARLLTPGGLAALEFGAGQGEAVRALYAAHGLPGSIRHDLAGHDRALVVSAPSSIGNAGEND